MARKRTRTHLNVYLNARLVGKLRRETSGAIEFQYDPTWLEWEHSFAVSLSLPLREDRYIGEPVIAAFDNLLPDSDDLRHQVAARMDAGGTDPYSLLAAIGRDCVGALQFLPDGLQPDPTGLVKAQAISDTSIAGILAGLKGAPLGLGEDEEFRISLAGVQEKTALLYWKDGWYRPHGTTATTHILKPQIGQRAGIDLSQSVENEYLCMRILDALGLPSAQTRIVDFDDQRALVVERFDRLWTDDHRLLRLPQEDCCQALSVPPARKYESDGGPGIVDILNLLKGSDDPRHDQTLFIKAQIVFWLMAATDGHAKNFSVFLHPGGGFSLAPLYDVMSTQPLFDTGQFRRNQMRLAMAVGNNRHYRLHDIIPRHFMQTVAKAGMRQEVVTDICDELHSQIPFAIETACNEMPPEFPQALLDSITGGMKERLRRLATG